MAKMTPGDFRWVFGRKTFESIDDFVADFTDYNRRRRERLHEEPLSVPLEDFSIASCNRVKLKFWGVLNDATEYDEMQIIIEGVKTGPLSFLEFMFHANNRLHEFLNNADHVFYEGLTSCEEEHGLAVYELKQGS